MEPTAVLFPTVSSSETEADTSNLPMAQAVVLEEDDCDPEQVGGEVAKVAPHVRLPHPPKVAAPSLTSFNPGATGRRQAIPSASAFKLPS